MTAMAGTVSPTNDDTLTVCAISLLSAMLVDGLHKGLGYGALALISACRATLIMSPCGDIRNVPFWRRYDNRNVP